MRHHPALLAAPLLAMLWLEGDLIASPPAVQPARIQPGAAFTALELPVLRPGELQLSTIKLGASAGRPLVICYFVIGDSLSEDVFLDVQKLAGGSARGKVEILGAAKLMGGTDVAKAAGRLSEMGASVPVIIEGGLTLATSLGLASVPAITLVDAGGVLRIAEAKSLRQTVAQGLTMSRAIQDAAQGKPVPTVARLPRYFPANELVGERSPDFSLQQFQGKEKVKLSELLDRNGRDNKITALYFWHPNCAQCKKVMPGIVVGANNYRKWIDVLSIAEIKDEDEARNCEDTVRGHGIPFPVLLDEGKQVTNRFKVISTPTMLFIRPDGVVDSVYTRADISYTAIFANRISSILKVEAGQARAGS